MQPDRLPSALAAVCAPPARDEDPLPDARDAAFGEMDLPPKLSEPRGAIQRCCDVLLWRAVSALGALSWRLGYFGRQWGEAWASEAFNCSESELESMPRVRWLRKACRRAQQATGRRDR